jgi:asparagine N-glycosylation enzyme membrane subunit Stt3
MSFLTDERGARSSARLLLWIELAVITAQTSAAVFLGKNPSNAIWSLHAGIITALAAGAWGPRVAQYLAPQLAGFAQSVGAALRRDPREPSKFDDHQAD